MNRRVAPMVYFVRRADGEGPIKIGCSEYPEGRVNALMCWSPYKLELVAHLPGDESLERRFHERFVAQHSHREWFHPSLELTMTMLAIRMGTFDIDTLPAGKRLASPNRKPWTPEQRHATGLRCRIAYLFSRAGIGAPASVRAAADLMEGLTGDARAAGIAIIQSYLADPLRVGSLLPYPWAAGKFEKWAARKGIPLELMPAVRKAA